MRKLRTLIFALIVLLLTAMSVQALQYKTIERYSGASASADWVETNGDTTIYKYISVSKTNDFTDIYLEIYTSGPDYWGYDSGYLCTDENVFKIDKKLNSASLSNVDINLYGGYYDEDGYYIPDDGGTVTVSADWIGKGDISTDSSISRSQSGNFFWKSSSSSKYRDASAIGSINGLDLGASSYASLYSFKSASMTMEK